MNKKSIGLILAAVLLTGCVSGPNVTEENALEVAIDDSNNDPSEVTASKVTKKDGIYTVVFTTESGQYTYHIGTDGLIKDRNYTNEITLEANPEVEEETAPKEEEKKEEPKTDDREAAAIEAALSNVGLSRDQTTSVTTSLNEDGSQYTVTIVAGDSTTVCVVEAATGNVISTMFN